MATKPTSGPCRICRHRSTGICPGCGGMLGHLQLGLPPCPVCPHGRHIAQDIDDANAELAEVYVFEDDGMAVEIGDGPGPEVVEALAISNEMRITQIANMLRCNPERIASVESVLGISGYMGS